MNVVVVDAVNSLFSLLHNVPTKAPGQFRLQIKRERESPDAQLYPHPRPPLHQKQTYNLYTYNAEEHHGQCRSL